MTDIIYDFPLYYDILFSWDRSAEAHFYDRVFELAGVAPDEPVLEVACGTGRIAIQLARLGRRVFGMDTSKAMLMFLESEALRAGVKVRTRCADMTTFSDGVVYGAIYNPLSSFRLLRSDAAAEAHLNAIARSLRIGGVYVLDLALCEQPDDPPVTTDEAWEMTRGGITVRATNHMVYVNDQGQQLELGWGVAGHLRNYTHETLSDRVAATPSLVINSWYPETAREGEDGVSTFNAEQPLGSCPGGRAMLVLRRV